MTKDILLALAIPTAYLAISTALLLSRHQSLPSFLLRLSTRRAIAWNAMVGISIALGALRWALRR